jgi:predicted phosphohydrolase
MGSTAIYQKFGMGDEGRTKDLEEAASFALNLYAFKNPIVGAGVRAMLGERSYLEQGLLSEEGRRKLEREVGRIKKTALNFARDVVEKYEDVIRTFVRDHLIRRETMVRMEIMDVLEDMGVKAACMYKRMCNELKKMGYL